MRSAIRNLIVGLGCLAVSICAMPQPVSASQRVEVGIAEGAAAVLHEPTGFVEHNGALYRVEKTKINGEEVKSYTLTSAAGARYTEQQFRALIAGQSPRIIAPALQQVIDDWAAVAAAGDRADEMIEVTIMLRDQPAQPIAREVHGRVRPQVDQFTATMQAISRQALPHALPMGGIALTPEEEKQFIPVQLPEGHVAVRTAAARQLDDLKRDAMREVYERAAAACAPSQQALGAVIVQLGGEVTANVAGAMNIIGARIPIKQIPQLAQHELIANIDINHPGAPELDNHRHSLGLETGFWANRPPITGGVHDCGVLDTGVQQSHPSLSSHTFLSNMGVTDTGTHGTGMAGILASTHATNRGMAFGLHTIVVARANDINTSMLGMNYIVSTGEPENTNYSFGNGSASGTDYTTTDQFFDGVIDTYGFMVSKSTGNGGYSATNLTITRPAPAYNLMASANMDDFNTIPRANDRITSSSSVGPTVAGRKKPDITSPGNNSMSCTPSGGFANIGGTSSASPHTGGGIILLYDMGATNVMAGKAILLNTTDPITDNGTSTTADDVYVQGSLWNRRYGWGYMNLGSAYLHGLDYFIDEVPPTPETGDFKLYKGQMFTFERATLVWQRHVAYNGSTFPTQVESLSDLDLFAFRESSNAQIAASTSAIDNVEQLHVTSDEASVVLKVEAFGSFDPDVTLERFALATQENFVGAAGPAFTGSVIHPANVAPGEIFTISIDVQNIGDLKAHNVSVQLSGVNVQSGGGDNPQLLNAIDPGAQASATWTVQAANINGLQAISVAILSNSYGEQFSANVDSSYTVGARLCIADIAPIGPPQGNGVVDVDDLLVVINAWGPCANPCAADILANGIVDTDDLLAVISAWGVCQ